MAVYTQLSDADLAALLDQYDIGPATSCKGIAEGQDIDVVEIDAASNTGVDNIRELRANTAFRPARARFKIYIIDEVHMLSTGAFNALLKTLEEPPDHVKFILATTEIQKVPATIRSRCQQIAMPLPDAVAALAWLKQQEVSDPEASLAAAGFSPLTALLLAKGENAAQYGQFIEQIGHPSRLDPLSLAEALQQTNLSIVVNWLQKWCYDLVSYRTSGKIRYYVKQLPAIQALSGHMDLPGCVTFTRELNVKQQLSHHPLNPRLFLEELFIAYAALMGKK